MDLCMHRFSLGDLSQAELGPVGSCHQGVMLVG